jgi:ABC-type multidrug transport system permease subunit
MIDERKSGVWSRAIVAGVKPSQFLVSHLIEGFVIMLVQFIELSVYILCFLLPPLTWKATGLLLLIFLVTGIAGIVFGVLVSLLAHDVSVSMHINQSFTKITIFICGESLEKTFFDKNPTSVFAYRSALADSRIPNIPEASLLLFTFDLSNDRH